MPCVETEELPVFHGVSHVELMGSDHIALAADAEELALDGVEVVFLVDLLGEEGVQRRLKALPGPLAVHGEILGTIGNPDIGHAGGAKLSADLGADPAAGLPMVDPVVPDRGVRAGKRESRRNFRVGKKRGVEIHAQPLGLRPVDPAPEVLRVVLAPLLPLASEIGIAGMEVETVRAGNQREGHPEILTQLLDGPRLAGVVTGGRQAASGEVRSGVLKSPDIVPLPAVHRNRRGGETVEGSFDVHPERGVGFLGDRVGVHKRY